MDSSRSTTTRSSKRSAKSKHQWEEWRIKSMAILLSIPSASASLADLRGPGLSRLKRRDSAEGSLVEAALALIDEGQANAAEVTADHDEDLSSATDDDAGDDGSPTSAVKLPTSSDENLIDSDEPPTYDEEAIISSPPNMRRRSLRLQSKTALKEISPTKGENNTPTVEETTEDDEPGVISPPKTGRRSKRLQSKLASKGISSTDPGNHTMGVEDLVEDDESRTTSPAKKRRRSRRIQSRINTKRAPQTDRGNSTITVEDSTDHHTSGTTSPTKTKRQSRRLRSRAIPSKKASEVELVAPPAGLPYSAPAGRFGIPANGLAMDQHFKLAEPRPLGCQMPVNRTRTVWMWTVYKPRANGITLNFDWANPEHVLHANKWHQQVLRRQLKKHGYVEDGRTRRVAQQ